MVDGAGTGVPGGTGACVSLTPTAGPSSTGAGLCSAPAIAAPTAMTAPAVAVVIIQVCTCDRFISQVSTHIMRSG